MAKKEISMVNDGMDAVAGAVRRALGAIASGTRLTWKVGAHSVSVDLSKVHSDNLAWALIHGMGQRIGDAAALGAGYSKKLGRVPTLEDKRDAMQALAAHYESGSDSWDVGRRGGPRADDTMEFLVRAFTGHTSKDGVVWTAEKAREWLTTKSKAERSQIATDRALPTWVRVEAQLAREASSVDVDKVMEGF